MTDTASNADLPSALAHAINIEVQWQILTRAQCPNDSEIQHWVQMAIDADRLLSASSIAPAANDSAAAESEAELTVRIVDSDEIRNANFQWRGKDRPTNVLSFPSDFPPEAGLSYYGDIMVCAEILLAESIEQGKSATAHWAHIVIHGTLHLLGYDHVELADALLMERCEIDILATLGIDDPYRAVGESEITRTGGQ